MNRLPKAFWYVISSLIIVLTISTNLNGVNKGQIAYAAEAEDYTTTTTTPCETTTYGWRETTTACETTTADWWTTTTHIAETTTEDWWEATTTATETTTAYHDRISAIYISDITLIENYDGYWDYGYYWDEINEECSYEYYHYNIYPQNITVIYNDGTHFTGTCDDVYNETGYWINYNNTQSYNNPWSVGTYYVSASLGNAKTTYKVEIIDTPIENIEVELEKTELIENVDGYLSYDFDENGEIVNSYYYYYVWAYIGEITFKKGFEHYNNEENFYYILTDNQSYDTPWEVGKHTVTFSCLGYEKEFEVEVIANPYKVKNISVEASRKLVDTIDGYFTNDYIFDEDTQDYIEVEYFKYSDESSNPIITVEFEDGIRISGKDYQINEQINVYPNVLSYQSYNNQWGIGTHTAYLEIFGELIPFDIEIIPYPISRIEFAKAPNKTEYIIGEYPDMHGAVIRVHYTSGECVDIPFERTSTYGYAYYLDEKIDDTHLLTATTEMFDTPGSTSLVVKCDQLECRYPVTVLDKKIDIITIKNSDSNELLIDAYYSDGTTDIINVLGFAVRDSSVEKAFKMHGGYILTDKGIFEAELYYTNDESYLIKIRNSVNGQWIQSNKLRSCKWIELHFKYSVLDSWVWGSLTNSSIENSNKSFQGKITSDNVDVVVLMSTVLNECSVYSSNLKNTYNASFVIDAIYQNFAVNNIDLTISENYNSTNNTIELNKELLAGWGADKLIQPQYIDDYWYVELYGIIDYNTLTYGSLYFVFNDELKIVAFSTKEMPVIEKPSVEIYQPTQSVIPYGDSIILHIDATAVPTNGYIEWSASNNNFDMVVSDDGLTCQITPQAKGDTTFTATIYNANGEAVSADEQVMTSKAGFFDRIIAFFKKLFGLTKIILQAY